VVADGDLRAALAIDSALADDDDVWNVDVNLNSFPARGEALSPR
jgi:hypothetical protein